MGAIHAIDEPVTIGIRCPTMGKRLTTSLQTGGSIPKREPNVCSVPVRALGFQSQPLQENALRRHYEHIIGKHASTLPVVAD